MSLFAGNKGWDDFISDSQDGNYYYGDDGNFGYRNEDGSGSYYGADGSYGYINSDGSGSYYGADSSWGYINSDGSGSYYDVDGNCRYINSDGSGSYYGANGSWGYINSDGSGSYFEGNENEDGFYDQECAGDANITTVADGIAALLGFGIGFSVSAYMAYKNAKCEEERIRKENQKIKQKKRKIQNIRIKAFLFDKKKIKTNFSADGLVGNDVEYVTERIKEAGFVNYETIPINDIYEGSSKKVGEVEQVVINGQSSFYANTMFSYKAQVIILYHAKREIAFPVSPKQSCKMTCEYLMKELHELGYTNIYMKKIADLITGWIHKNGSIEYVLVNGKSKYRAGDMFNYDVEIVIAYHTFKKDDINA